jgi:mono/diheme cytochrome c family protein
VNAAIIFALLAAGFSQAVSSPPKEAQAPAAPAASAGIEQGKAVFVARCAKCHDADANKKLPDGSTLLNRLAKSKDPEARLGTRLKNEQERHQVFLYIQSLMTQAGPAESKSKTP